MYCIKSHLQTLKMQKKKTQVINFNCQNMFKSKLENQQKNVFFPFVLGEFFKL